jgi:hypothetical protein
VSSTAFVDRRLRSATAVAVTVFLFAFGLYVFTAPRFLRAYEPETAAVTEGFVRTGDFKILTDSPLNIGGGIQGKDGKLIGRVGLPQPLLESPFYLIGWGLDGIDSGGDGYRFRARTLLFYNGFIMAIVAALVFLIMERLQPSRRWSIAIAVLFAVASLAWPYAKIGVEATTTLGFALVLLGALRTRDSERLWPWCLVGFGGGLAVAAKQYTLPAIAAMAILMWPAFAARPDLRLRRLLAVGLPFAAWIAAMALYNWSRLGSPFKTGNTGYQTTLAAPLNAFGFLFSPGKGLLWYSPLVAIGVLGLIVLWRRDRRLVVTLGIVMGCGIAAASLVPHWTDETWGPRYLVPVAWLPLLAIPFWVTTLRRRQVLAVVAILAVAVQLVAVLVPFTQIVKSNEALTGFPLYQQRDPGEVRNVPFGRDPNRWIPQLSPLLIQTAIIGSRIGVAAGTGPITLTYAPYEGAEHKLVISREFLSEIGFERPDFWWVQSYAGAGDVVAALFAALVAGAAGWSLLQVATGRPRSARPVGAEHVA